MTGWICTGFSDTHSGDCDVLPIICLAGAAQTFNQSTSLVIGQNTFDQPSVDALTSSLARAGKRAPVDQRTVRSEG